MKKVILLLAVVFSINASAQHKSAALTLGDTIVGEVETWYTYVGDGEQTEVTLFYELSSEYVEAIELRYNAKVEYVLDDEQVTPDTAGDLLIAAGQWKNASFGFAAAGAVGALALVQGDPDTASGVSLTAGLLAIFCELRGNYLIMKAGRELNREMKVMSSK